MGMERGTEPRQSLLSGGRRGILESVMLELGLGKRRGNGAGGKDLGQKHCILSESRVKAVGIKLVWLLYLRNFNCCACTLSLSYMQRASTCIVSWNVHNPTTCMFPPTFYNREISSAC